MKLAQFDCDLVWDNIVSVADVYVIEINVLLGLLEDRKKIEPFPKADVAIHILNHQKACRQDIGSFSKFRLILNEQYS